MSLNMWSGRVLTEVSSNRGDEDTNSTRSRSSSRSSSADSATAIQIRRFPFSKSQRRATDLEDEAAPEKDDDEESVHEVKNFKYWATRLLSSLKKVRQSSKKKRKASFESASFGSLEGEFDDLDGQQARIKPEAIDTLCQLTKFSRRELQLMYRGFKQDCPSGVVKEETFKLIYAQFFPRGADSSQYAHFIFNTFDPDHTGAITFTDFVVGLSVLARGSIQDKLRWAFSLYDLNGDGMLTKDELTLIVSSIYDLMGGRPCEPVAEAIATREHVDRVFQKLDLNKDGVITVEEFLDSCLKDENITRSLAVFNTVL